MTKIKEEAWELLNELPDEKIVYLINTLKEMKRTDIGDVKRKQDALKKLENMIREAPELDYDKELEEYRKEKFEL